MNGPGHKISVARMCCLLEVSRSGYYKHLKACPSKRAVRHSELLNGIRQAYNKSRKTYGCRRVHTTLVKQGQPCNRKTVAALMKRHQIAPQRKRKYKATTDSKHSLPISHNILNREFGVSKPNIAWVTDITYIETQEGWLYLAVFIDLFSRQVVGWKARSEMTADLVLDAYAEGKMAVGRAPLLVHSDRGTQYASDAFRTALKETNCIQSMSRKGNCWDNAVAESFFGMLKTEMIYHTTFESRDQAIVAIFDYIEIFYNRSRRHSALGYLTPFEFTLKGEKAA